MTFADLLTRIAAELALFSAVGFLLFAVNDLLVEIIYFVRRFWRSATVYRRFPRAFGKSLAEAGGEHRFMAIFVPAWDESSVIASMLRATLERLEYGNYRIFGGHYRHDPATAAAIASVGDPRIEPVLDAYVQAGVVGLTSRDLFVDGAFAFTRPVYGRFSAGFGLWGGAQPGVYRIDAGPRLSVRLRDNIHAHVDWRQRVVGNAQPASGPALTLAADF